MALFGRKREERAAPSLSDPAFAEYFGIPSSLSGVTVSETSALGVSAVFRAVSLIAGTVAALPLKSYRTLADGSRERVGSFLDTPAGPDSDSTAFEWTETLMVSLLLHGNAYFLKVYNAAGALAGLQYIHPSLVSVTREGGRKVFRIAGKTLTDTHVLHIPALSTDGLVGRGPLQVARDSFGTTIAGDRAAARMFSTGAMVSGLVTPEDANLPEEEAKEIAEGFRRVANENPGGFAFINRLLKVTPWTLSARDAQFLESRTFQISEVARWFGLPPHLLAETQKQTSWGSGVQEQNHGLARFTLMPWTDRIEQRLTRLLPSPRFCEFDYSGLLQPTPAEEIRLLIEQMNGGLITQDEARKVRNLPPLDPQESATVDSTLLYAYIALVNAGFDASDAAVKLGLPDITYLGPPEGSPGAEV
jgi:HK97 family phage portal protein